MNCEALNSKEIGKKKKKKKKKEDEALFPTLCSARLVKPIEIVGFGCELGRVSHWAFPSLVADVSVR